MKTKTFLKATHNKAFDFLNNPKEDIYSFKDGKSISVNDCKTYTINLTCAPEPIIDLDELECICDQMAAIQFGWGHDFGTVFYQEDQEDQWEWRDNGNTTTTSA